MRKTVWKILKKNVEMVLGLLDVKKDNKFFVIKSVRYRCKDKQ